MMTEIDRQHIYPINDLRPHNTDSPDCWCNPTVDEENGLIIHNSMDGREKYETNNTRLN